MDVHERAAVPPANNLIREALAIILLASACGVAYTAFLSKGFFAAAPPSPVHRPPPVVTLDEARRLFDTGNVLFVDARPPFDFGLGHIRGAVNIPLKDFELNAEILTLIPKNRPLVTYCDGEECNSSSMLAAKLDSAGYVDVRVFFGGWKEWTARHLPVEGQ